MIALGSTSYPYLAVAQHYGISYSNVLEYVDVIENRQIKFVPFVAWRRATFEAYQNEIDRRKQLLGI